MYGRNWLGGAVAGTVARTTSRCVAKRSWGCSRRVTHGLVLAGAVTCLWGGPAVALVEAAEPAFERQPKYATYTVRSCDTAGRMDGPFCPRVLRVSMRRDV